METETTAAQTATRVPPRRSGLNPRPQQAIVGTPQAASRGGRGRLLLLVLAAVAAAAVLRFLPVNQWPLGFAAGTPGAGAAGTAEFPVTGRGAVGGPPPGTTLPPRGALRLRVPGGAPLLFGT